ncbi:hypothetical protein ZYGR_0AE00110, partial [Zygosaccharomyces rouxii]
PSGSGTSVPSGSGTSVPSGSRRPIPSGSTTSVLSGSTSPAASKSTTSIPSDPTASVPSGSKPPVPSGSTVSMPAHSVSPLPSGSESTMPPRSTSSVSAVSKPVSSHPSMLPISKSSVLPAPSTVNKDPSVASGLSSSNNSWSGTTDSGSYVTSASNTVNTDSSITSISIGDCTHSTSLTLSSFDIEDSICSLSPCPSASSPSASIQTNLVTSMPLTSEMSCPSSSSGALICTESQVECESSTLNPKVSIPQTTSATDTIVPMTFTSADNTWMVTTAAPYRKTTLLSPETDIFPAGSLIPSNCTTRAPNPVSPTYSNMSSNLNFEPGFSAPCMILPTTSSSSLPCGYNNVSNPLLGINPSPDCMRTTTTLVPPCTTNFWNSHSYATADSTYLVSLHTQTFGGPNFSQFSGSTAYNASSETATSIVQLAFHTVTTTTVSCSSEAIPCDRPISTATNSITFEAALGKGVLYPSTRL